MKNKPKPDILWPQNVKKLLLTMKISFLLLALTVLNAYSTSIFSQNGTVSVDMQNVTVREVVLEIERQGGINFLFNDNLTGLNKRVNVSFTDQPIKNVLTSALGQADMMYEEIKDDFVVLLDNSANNHRQAADNIIFQQGTITGTVTDQEGITLPGVSIIVQGTDIGTVTDADGNYSLENVTPQNTIIFSYVGMETRHIRVEDQTTINVTMEPEAIGLDEIVVVGYGTQRRANLTGAVSIATSERLDSRPIRSTAEGLQGVIPNLNITMGDGDPMTRANFNVRGFESITGGSPLILVDGVPMDPHLVNPNDIESVNVLKDAASAAIYGARAAFGVILIETKSGREGVNVSFNSEMGASSLIFYEDRYRDSYEFAKDINRVSMEARGIPHFSERRTEGFRRYSENPTLENEWSVEDGYLFFHGSVNPVDYTLANFSPRISNDLAISGATDRTNYYVSIGQMNSKGFFKHKEGNLNYNRYNMLMKADFDATDWLNLDSRISSSIESNNTPHHYQRGYGLEQVSRHEIYKPLIFPDLPYYLEPGDSEDFDRYKGMYFQNRVITKVAEGGRDLSDLYDTWLTQGATITPFEGLMVRSEFAYQIFNRHQEWQASRYEQVDVTSDIGSDGARANLNPIAIDYGYSAEDYMQNRSTHNRYYVFNTYAQYTMDRFDDHSIRLTGGFNQELARNQWSQARANDLSVPYIRNIRATTGRQFTDGRNEHFALRGYFYRFNYRYQDKYLFESSGRYDLTSRFAKGRRGGFFPSFSAGWRISHEGFMEATSGWLNNLMLRASYGSLGNQMVSTYAYIPSMSMGQRSIIFDSGPNPYVGPAPLVSGDLTWETVTTRNLGMDMMLLDNRLEFMVDAYIRETKDMLMRKSYPALLGVAAPESNAADLETRGWETNITWRDRINQDWSYGINIALSDNQTEITRYENPTGDINDYYVGQKIGEIWGFETVGIFQTDEEVANAPSQAALGSGWRAGDIQYADLNGDGVIDYGSNTLDDPGDRRIIGNNSARYAFGINTDMTFRNWTMNIFFQGLFRDLYPPTGGYGHYWPWQSDMVERWHTTESWSEDNPDAHYPAPRYHRYEDSFRNFITQTRFLENGAYIRLKNLTINYNIPHRLAGRVGLTNASVYLSGLNLWEYTGLPDAIDPEDIYSVNVNHYRSRIFTMGIRASF